MTPGSTRPAIAVLIPARNEAALIASTVASVLRAVAELHATTGPGTRVEVVVVDNASTDGTAEALAPFAESGAVRLVACSALGAAHARNTGARSTDAPLLIFLDADTHLPLGAIRRFATLIEAGYEAGIARLGPLDGGHRARAWWAFWNAVRLLPLPRAKAMPACMFCTRAAFEEFGPFDERVAIGEEWPILAGLYRRRRDRLIYDQSTVAQSSGRRMELQPFGYSRTLLRYVAAILCHRGRIHYSDRIRHVETPSRRGSSPHPGPILQREVTGP